MLESVKLLHLEAKVMHRYIMPENFRVTDKGQVKLINFGFAREILD
jgi:serine/threonine protein kinase